MIEFIDTIAEDEEVISQRRVSVSDSDGSVGSVISADEVRKGHDAMRAEEDVVVRMAPDGT
jgi:hypothetical protein